MTTQAEKAVAEIEGKPIDDKTPVPLAVVKAVAKKSKLKAVDPKAAEPSRPKILIYGKYEAGKTWVSLDFPSAYYFDTEGGANLSHYTDKLKASGGMYFGPEQGSLDFQNIINEIKILATEKHHYKTIVIDSVSKLQDTEVAAEAERLAQEGKKNEFGADKKPATSYQRNLSRWLMRCDMTAIIIAHSKPEWGLDAKGERTEIGTTFDAWQKLGHDLHLCLEIIRVNKDKSIARVKKSRLLGFPSGESFTWTYEEFAKRYGKDVIEREAVEQVLATPQQIKRYTELMAAWKAPEGQQDKWLTAANADTIEEIEEEKMSKIIAYIEKQLTGEK